VTIKASGSFSARNAPGTFDDVVAGEPSLASSQRFSRWCPGPIATIGVARAACSSTRIRAERLPRTEVCSAHADCHLGDTVAHESAGQKQPGSSIASAPSSLPDEELGFKRGRGVLTPVERADMHEEATQ
jgi:peptide methionine sulfoxide reductase MsrB